jgi:hypothetical protein
MIGMSAMISILMLIMIVILILMPVALLLVLALVIRMIIRLGRHLPVLQGTGFLCARHQELRERLCHIRQRARVAATCLVNAAH